MTLSCARGSRRSLCAFSAVALAFACSFAGLPSRASAQREVPVNIESVPPGAQVFLDSTEGPALGVTPIPAARVVPGPHTLIFRLPNFEEARLGVSVARRRETFRAVLRALGVIEVASANDDARGATVRIDGQPVGGGTLGAMPLRVENLPPGRHQVEIQRDGFRPFQQWVDVQGGQVVRVAAMLEREAPRTGSILVAADEQGAPIFLDGRPVGATTTVLDDVPAGMHQLEIRPAGTELQPYAAQVLVQAGQRASVTAQLRRASVAPTTGTIAVITDVGAARVRVNGRELAEGAFSAEGLAPGNYVVQVMAEGYLPFRREVQVAAGQTSSVDAQLTREMGPSGRIDIVVTSPQGARVTVDGDERAAPYVVNQPDPGTHAVIVRAPGHEEVSFTCSTAPDAAQAERCERSLSLVPMAVPLRVRLAQDIEGGATLSIDGRDVGAVPYEGRIPVGDHVFEVRAPGHETFREQRLVEFGPGLTVEASLRDSSEEQAAEGTSHSALPIAMNHPMLDLSTGWPYLGELRLGIGLHELVDAGVTIRTFGRITEFEGRVRVGTRILRQLAVGGQARFGGGIGPSVSLSEPSWSNCDGDPVMPGIQTVRSGSVQQDCVARPGAGTRFDMPVNTALFSLEGTVSLLLEPVASVSLWLGVDVSSDEYAATARQSGAFVELEASSEHDIPGEEICRATSTGLACDPQRQTMARLRLGGAVDFVLSPNWNVWALFEGVLAQPRDHRRLLSGFLADAADLRIYPRAGVTYKF